MLLVDTESLRIHGLTNNPFRTNCFIIETNEGAFVIDPAGDGALLTVYLQQREINIQFLIATHYHFDHVSAAHFLLEKGIGKTLFIHPNESQILKHAGTYSLLLEKKMFFQAQKISLDYEYLEESINKMGFGVKHLPGHTPGHIILFTKDKKFLFSGDMIINNLLRTPRTFIAENKEELYNSTLQMLELFSDNTIIFPGHGKVSLMEVERLYNAKINQICSVN
jgi:hydroxyacylglutathione hydrolase